MEKQIKSTKKIINFTLGMSGKRIVIALRGAFRIQSTIYNGAFHENSEQLKVVKYFCKEAPSQMSN